jgi:urocanate hydratase
MGVIRHVDAGYESAAAAGVHIPMQGPSHPAAENRNGETR